MSSITLKNMDFFYLFIFDFIVLGIKNSKIFEFRIFKFILLIDALFSTICTCIRCTGLILVCLDF